jgi:hypothetical protein
MQFAVIYMSFAVMGNKALHGVTWRNMALHGVTWRYMALHIFLGCHVEILLSAVVTGS